MSTPSKQQPPEDEKVAAASASRPPTAPSRSATYTGADASHMLRSRPSFDLETLKEIAEKKMEAAAAGKDSDSSSSSSAAAPHSPFESMLTPLKQQPPEDEKAVTAAAAGSHSRPPTPPSRSATSTDTDALRGVNSPRPDRPFGLHWVKEYGAGSSSRAAASAPGVAESSLSEEASGSAEKGEAEASLSPAMYATPPPSAGEAEELMKLLRIDEGAVKKLVCSSSWAAPSIDELIVAAAREPSVMVEEAWERLRRSIVFYRSKPVGTLAAMDPNAEDLNYNQVFVRDFVPAGLAYLMKNPSEPDIVKNFLLKTLHLQGHEKMVDNFTLGEGVLPASFKVSFSDSPSAKEMVVADFGGHAIGRVAPVDSGFWWIILLRAYVRSTNDHALAERPGVQNGMKLILKLCLSDGFDTFPTLLCADGCCMIDRRMGIYGYPIEIQALFYFALRCARELLKPENDGEELLKKIDNRITALSFHIQNYYWLDFTQLNNIYRYKTEEYSHTAVNKFNVMPESIPDWVFDFMPSRGGYLIGNVSPARMDFRWFLVGNCIAILSCLATPDQAEAIMNLIEERWDKLIGEMPLKIAYPALEGHEWRIITGCDSKNTQWSYHNGGSWPTLLWLLAAACIKTRRRGMAMKAINLAEQRLSKDGWPEYYDGKTGKYIGKQARKYQTWSMSGYLIAKMLIENPTNCSLISLEEDTRNAPRHSRSTSL